MQVLAALVALQYTRIQIICLSMASLTVSGEYKRCVGDGDKDHSGAYKLSEFKFASAFQNLDA